MRERAVVTKYTGDKEKLVGFHVSDDDSPVVGNADLEPDGSIRARYEGDSPSNETGSSTVARLFMEHLNAGGGTWTLSQPEGEVGEDAVLVSANRARLPVQVTRAEQKIWPKLNEESDVTASYQPERDADALMSAIERKWKHADPNVVLLLDDAHSGRFLLGSTVELFIDKHGGAASAVGFKEVWLVGPTSDQVVKLDRPERGTSA